MVRSSLLLLVFPVLVSACESAPPADPNNVDESSLMVEILSNRDVYRPLDLAVARITNRSGVPVFRDRCAGHIEGRRSRDDEWNGSYGSGWACAIPGGSRYPEPERIDPGRTISDSLHINHRAYEGDWRFQYFIYDEDGDLLPLDQRISNVFQVVGDS